MNRNTVEWTRLNAYVDGELPPGEAAFVAEAIARSPALARQVAALSALKATVGAAVPKCPSGIASTSRRSRPWLKGAAVAAMLLLGLILGSVWFAEMHHPAPDIEFVLRLHHAWSDAQDEAPDAVATRVDGRGTLQYAYVPDLTQVDLVFDRVRQIRVRGGRGLHVGYRGPRGCMVSLILFREPSRHDVQLTRVAQPDHTAWHWRAEGISFYLLAPKMDQVRLSGIARVVQRLTRARLPLDPAGILAFEEARTGAEPCIV